jgi:tetratricopeptide (TPR) repeat protein/DNA-binding XRE family transcriptional regulator
MGSQPSAGPPVAFAGLLRKLRTDAGLTQEELARAAKLSPRAISDLERGINLTARKDTARLLADALDLAGAARADFEAVARGHAPLAGEPPPGGAALGGGGVAAATRTLPRDIASFTGREPELGELVGAVAGTPGWGGPEGPEGVVGIHAIGGMAGVGKTALAVHAAHRLAPQFPGGQIFLSLHGHTPGQQPVDPADALASLLLTAGVPAGQIPAGLEQRMAQWRDRLAGKQLLLVLDDAASSEQVRPLLPGTGGSLVLVTSRRHLSALEDARTISLDTLPPGQAAELLVRLAARPALDPADPAVGAITRLCGYLPLAIGMLARRLHHHPAWSPADLADELEAARDRLDLMHAENLSVAAAFNLSYADLSEGQQRLFRRLGLHPGPDIDAYAAAALDEADLSVTRRQLEALYGHYLLTEPTRGRYRLHDLIREHAHTVATRDDAAAELGQATGRLLDYYQDASASVNTQLARYTRPRPATPRTGSCAIPDLPDSMRALAWARAERANLLTCLDQMTREGRPDRVVTLTAALTALLEHDGPWTDALALHASAVRAARHLGDRSAEAYALSSLGAMRRLTGDLPDAATALEAALAISLEIGDQLAEANARNNLGVVLVQTGRLDDAAGAFDAAIGLYRDVGDRLGQAGALGNLGNVRRVTAQYAAAAGLLEEALDIYRDAGDRLGQARILNSLGSMHRLTSGYPAAVGALEAALELSHETGDRLVQANALFNLGSVRSAIDDNQGAAEALEAALGIYRDIGDPQGQSNAFIVLALVRRLTGEFPAAIDALEESLLISGGLGDQLGRANALLVLGGVRRLAADYAGAAEALQEALSICLDMGSRGGETEALNELGMLHRIRGDLDEAAACHTKALSVAREIGSNWDEAHALAGLARCALAAGRAGEAVAGLKQALEIFRRLGSAEAAEVSGELDALRSAGHPGASEP